MDKRLYVELPPFTGRNVPITEIAKAIGKDAHYVRIGIQQGILKFGVAMKMGDSNEFSYYCSDRKVWEETGYFNGEAKKQGKEKALSHHKQNSKSLCLLSYWDAYHHERGNRPSRFY